MCENSAITCTILGGIRMIRYAWCTFFSKYRTNRTLKDEQQRQRTFHPFKKTTSLSFYKIVCAMSIQVKLKRVRFRIFLLLTVLHRSIAIFTLFSFYRLVIAFSLFSLLWNLENYSKITSSTHFNELRILNLFPGLDNILKIVCSYYNLIV